MSKKKKIFLLIFCYAIVIPTVGLMTYVCSTVGYNNIALQMAQANLKYSEMLYPTVRVEHVINKGSGSGVIIHRQHIEQDNTYVYYVIASVHVIKGRFVSDLKIDGIRGIYETVVTDPGMTIRVFRNAATEWKDYGGEVVVESSTNDLALIKFQTVDYLPNIARLTDTDVITGVEIFDEVYAVGCQFGKKLIPTKGIIAGFLEHDDVVFLLHTAHIMPGSSGGGLFKKYNNQYHLIGIQYSIQTHNSHLIPHYVFAISTEMIYKFLHENDMSFIYENGMINEAQYTS